MSEFVIMLEPEQDLFRHVERIKQEALSIAGRQQYISDSPHVTLYLASFGSFQTIRKRLDPFAKGLDAIPVDITGWRVFKDDKMTKRTTLACAFSGLSAALLRKIQVKTIAALRQEVTGTATRYVDAYASLSTACRQNIDAYHFPFVNLSWQPHITIASFEKAAFQKVWKKVSRSCPTGTYLLNAILINELREEMLTAKKRYTLKGG